MRSYSSQSLPIALPALQSESQSPSYSFDVLVALMFFLLSTLQDKSIHGIARCFEYFEDGNIAFLINCLSHSAVTLISFKRAYYD